MMDWLLANPQISSNFAALGEMQGNNYVVADNCLGILEEINLKLLLEDQMLRTFRRAIAFGENVKNDLLPLLIHVKNPAIIDATIRILVNLTIPVECLLNIEVMQKSETGRHTIFELNKLLSGCKVAFTDSRTTKAIIDFIKTIVEKDLKISAENCDSVNNCLLLLRNILHIPEEKPIAYNYHGSTTQNQLVWNLFAQSIDKLLLYLMSCSKKSYWSVTMVQLIALMYKDQHVNTLQKLLNVWFEASVSDSSEDNESNTSPPKQCSGDSSPMLTSDPTSDSSDERVPSICDDNSEEAIQFTNRLNQEFLKPLVRVKPIKHQTAKERDSNSIKSKNTTNISANGVAGPSTAQNEKKREYPSSQSEMSDCGYGTQVENQESISTSSNEDESPPVHHPPCTQKQRYNSSRNSNTNQLDKKELRRKKLVKRSRSNLINMKGLLHHTPTDEDISYILKEFTVDFLLKGYNSLVKELHAQLLCDLQIQIDTSHFFWLVTYFLKFAAQLELDLELLTSVLSHDVISYLTYEGVSLSEQLELATKYHGSDLKPCLRRMHLVITAIREFIQALERFKCVSHLSVDDKEYLKTLQCQIVATEDLKCLFVLLLRKYNPMVHSKQYLQDLVVTNHILLLLIDGVSSNGSDHMVQHIQQFATAEIMHQYGLLLEDFRENGEYVNDCIFTMMHHVGGDVGHSATLFQPIILKTYSQIWETEYELCDDWSDLIEYVIHKFINTPQQKKFCLMPNVVGSNVEVSIDNFQNDENLQSSWSQEEIDNLYWYYVQSKNSSDLVGKIIKQFQENGNRVKSRLAVIQLLLQQDIIPLLEYDELMRHESEQFERLIKTPTSVSLNDAESGIEVKELSNTPPIPLPADDTQLLRDRLCFENKGNLLLWLQSILLECCYIKLSLNNTTSPKSRITVMEPVPYHSIIKKQSVPVIPWNEEQSNMLIDQPFVLLLHKLGFHLPADAGKLYVRIPEFWTADILYDVAVKLGPINKQMLKFDLCLLKNADEIMDECGTTMGDLKEPILSQEYFAIPRPRNCSSILGHIPEPTPTPNWLHIVMKSKSITEKSILFGGRLYTSSVQHLASSTTTRTNSIESTTSSLLQMNDSSIVSSLTEIPSIDVVMGSTNVEVPTNTSNSNILFIKTLDESKLMEIVEESNKKMTEGENAVHKEDAESEHHDVNSNFETASIASDLTRMYVSDEEDKNDDVI